LQSISGVGSKALEDILEKRPFVDFLDFYERTNSRVVNKTVVEALIKAGAFDGEDRNELLFYYKELRNNDLVQEYLIEKYEPTTVKDVMRYERDLLSFSISYPSKWEKADVGDRILYKGNIKNCHIHTTSNNNKMAFFDLEFEEGVIDVVAFPRRYYKFKEYFGNGNYIKLLGEKTNDNSLKVIGVDGCNE